MMVSDGLFKRWFVMVYDFIAHVHGSWLMAAKLRTINVERGDGKQ